MHLPSRVLAPLFATAGVLHVLTPHVFDELVPPQLPGHARTYTYASGIAELGAAVLLAAPLLGPRSNPGHQRRAQHLRRFGGLFSAALLAAMWPANFCMAWRWRNQPWPKFFLALARLPLQIPLLRAAWRVYAGERSDQRAGQRSGEDPPGQNRC